MAGTNAGRNLICNFITGTGTVYSNANAHIGVGDSTAVFAATQTDLQASSNKFRQPMDATFPSVATNVITFQSTFGTANANFHWQEWGIFNASSSGTMLTRLVEDNGTKTNTLLITSGCFIQ